MTENANERWRQFTGCPPRRRVRRKPYHEDEEPEGLFKPPQRPSGTLEDNPFRDPRDAPRADRSVGISRPVRSPSAPKRAQAGPAPEPPYVEFTSSDVIELRHKFHASQRHFAQMFGISVGTVRNWEQGRRRPAGPARALLRVARAHPEAVSRTLWRYRRTWWMD